MNPARQRAAIRVSKPVYERHMPRARLSINDTWSVYKRHIRSPSYLLYLVYYFSLLPSLLPWFLVLSSVVCEGVLPSFESIIG